MMLVATEDLFQVKETIFSLFRPKKVHFKAKIDNFPTFCVYQLFSVDAKMINRYERSFICGSQISKL